MAREMLSAIFHARLQQAMHEGCGKLCHHRGVGMKGPLANNFTARPIQIEHRRKAEIYPNLTQFLGQ